MTRRLHCCWTTLTPAPWGTAADRWSDKVPSARRKDWCGGDEYRGLLRYGCRSFDGSFGAGRKSSYRCIASRPACCCSGSDPSPGGSGLLPCLLDRCGACCCIRETGWPTTGASQASAIHISTRSLGLRQTAQVRSHILRINSKDGRLTPRPTNCYCGENSLQKQKLCNKCKASALRNSVKRQNKMEL